MKALRAIPLCIGCLLASAAPASAGTNLGATCDNPTTTSNQTLIQRTVAAGSPSYSVPAEGGVITLWEVRESTAKTLKLKLFKPTANPTQFLVEAESEAQPAVPGDNIFKTRLPVTGGQILGLTTLSAPIKLPFCSTGVPGNNASTLTPSGDPAVSTTVTLNTAGPGTLIDVGAYIEPDADHDGFGDESQDACPSEATAGAACVPVDRLAPQLSGVKPFKLSKLLKKSVIEVSVLTNEAATATGTGTITVPGKKAYALKTATVAVPAGGRATLKFKVPKKLLKVLRKKGRAKSLINVAVTDAAGNQSKAEFPSKLKIIKTRKVIHR